MSALSIRSRSVITLALVAGLLVSLVGVPQAEAQTRDAEPDQQQVDARRAPIEVLKMKCKTDIVQGERGVLCRWRPSTNDNLRGYKLLRIANGEARELIATVAADGRLGAFDTDISAGDRLVYGVVALNRVGRVIGQSRPARIGIPG